MLKFLDYLSLSVFIVHRQWQIPETACADHTELMFVNLDSWPILVCPYVGVLKSPWLMSSITLPQQGLACFVNLNNMVCDIESIYIYI